MASEILQSMLENVPSVYDKSEGSFIYDALAPVAEQLAIMDGNITDAKAKMTVANLTGDELTLRVNDSTGIERKVATFATGVVTVTGTGTINMGDLFETPGGVQFKATEAKTISISGNINVSAVIAGLGGNVPSNSITLFPVTLSGFTAVNNANPTSDGFDQETDADLIIRYYERLRTPATSGNKNHYNNWAKEVPGVGLARVIPLWDGANTVKVVIIDSERQTASTELIASVQEYIDPEIAGLGEGTAPIGAHCTVVSATGIPINISATITKSSEYTLQTVTDNIEDSLVQYLKEIAFIESIVSYAKIGNAILGSEGVLDYSGLSVNGGTANINIDNTSVATLGTVTIIE